MAENDFSQYPDIEELLSKPRPSEKDALEKVDISEANGVYNLSEHIGENTPELPEVLIEDIMRVGGVMNISAVSKAGKSMLTYQMAIALAMGWEWIGKKCKVSKTLYCDFENDYREGLNRFQRIIEYRNLDPKKLGDMIHMFYPKGEFIYDYSDILPKVENIANELGVDVVVLDSVYNLLGNLDENSAGDISKLYAAIKNLGNKTGCSVVMIHHFSKGNQSAKSSMDRGSGSGVFARAPSAILTVEELELTDDLIDELFETYGSDVDGGIAFRIEATLRSFRRPEPINGIYCYPIHMVDYKDILKDARPMEVARTSDLRQALNKKQARSYKREVGNAYQAIIESSGMKYGEPVPLSEVAKMIGVKDGTLANHTVESGFKKDGAWIYPKQH